MHDEASILARERRELITRRLPVFTIGWLGALGVWLVVFAFEGRVNATAFAMVAIAAVALRIALAVSRADPAAPRVVPVVVATCVALGVGATALVAEVGAYGEILAFMLLTLYLAAALLFSWGWRAELVLLLTTLVPWVLVLDRFRLFVPPLELAAAVSVGAGLALAIAEASARNARHVSRRRRAQERATLALQASRDAYRDLAEHARDMIWSADREGRLTYANEALGHFLGLTPAEMMGRRIPDFFTAHPENPDFDAAVSGLLAGEPLPPIAVECATPRGPRWAEATTSAVRDEHGAIIGVRGISRDVQERRDAEAALRASEERFRSAFDHAAIGMVVVGLDRRPLQANRAFCEMLGYSLAELEARTMDTLAHPDDLARATAETLRLIRGEQRAFQMEKRYLHKDGHVVWCLLNLSLTRDADGQPLHLIAQIQDISVRKAAEEALRTSESRYRGLVEAAQEPVTRFGLDGRLTFANDAYCQAIGYRREEIVGRNPMFLLHPDDHATTLAGVRAVLHPPHRHRLESRGLTPQGWRWFEWEVSGVRDASERVVEIQMVGRDVTARRQAELDLRESEERFRSAFEDAAVGMGVTTIDGRTLRVNRALCEMLGYSEQELLACRLEDIVHPDDRVPLDADRSRLTEGADRSYRAERRYLRKDGRVLWVHVTASMVCDANGEPLYFIGQIQDITERHLAEEALRSSLVELRHSEEKLRRLAQRQVAIREEERKRLGFDLHDDVCQELVGVGILVESLRRKLAPMAAEHAASFDRVVGYLGEVVEHVRLLARELRPLLLHDLGLDGGLRSLADGMSSATVRVVSEFRGTIPPLEEESEVTVYRIAQEALANAVRHAGASRIVVALVVHDGMLRLEVRDDGRGFDPAARPAAALGLASMEERALALGGRLLISSAPGEGTTVALACPIVVRAAALMGPVAPSPTRSSSRPAGATRRRPAARD